MDRKKHYKTSSSALRILLNHPELNNIEQFRTVRELGNRYIYNTRSRNVIATLRDNPRHTLIRYRDTSHYAEAIVQWAKRQPNVTLVASHNLSRRQRRVARHLSDSSRSRLDAIQRISRGQIWADNLTGVRFNVPDPAQAQQTNLGIQGLRTPIFGSIPAATSRSTMYFAVPEYDDEDTL